jgi:hypothetical protein
MANVWHTATRLAFDQTVENVTGAGAPPRSWPVQEQVIDVFHEAVYSVVTGIIADRWIPPVLESHGGRISHGRADFARRGQRLPHLPASLLKFSSWRAGLTST